MAKGVVESVDRRVGAPGGTQRLLGDRPSDHLPGCGDDVVRAARVRGGKVFAQPRSGTARPEQETDYEADREADGDVLDANQPDLPTDRLDQVEENEQHDREGCLACGE